MTVLKRHMSCEYFYFPIGLLRLFRSMPLTLELLEDSSP